MLQQSEQQPSFRIIRRDTYRLLQVLQRLVDPSIANIVNGRFHSPKRSLALREHESRERGDQQERSYYLYESMSHGVPPPQTDASLLASFAVARFLPAPTSCGTIAETFSRPAPATFPTEEEFAYAFRRLIRGRRPSRTQ